MRDLERRLKKLETRVPEDRVIFISWLRDPGEELTRVASGDEKWTRQESETEQQFLGRVRKELEVIGPYPRFGIVS
jgi:hypothetical protein